jgi:Tol biopolymer transport system component
MSLLLGLLFAGQKSPARGFIVFVIGAALFTSGILTMLSLQLLSNPSAFATFPGENGKIAFTSERDGGNWEIYVMNSDGSNPIRLTDNPAFDSHPTWSPDGTKIAFESTRDRGYYDIYVMNSDGSNPIRLTDSPTTDAWPTWSPDGTKIAFGSHRDGKTDIYVMNSDGSNPIRLTDNPATDELPTWSPDGTKIAFGSWLEGNSDIYVMNSDGSNPIRLTDNPAFDSHPTWSPDGTKIAFTSERDGGNSDIYVMNSDGSNPIRLTDNPATDEFPTWSPDGTKIAFGSWLEGNLEIYVMNSDGSNPIRLTDNPSADLYPDWGTAPDEVEVPEDATPPTLTVPEDITAQATTTNGGTEVTFTVTAEDDIDGTATLEEDGVTITQDDIGGDITISCEPASGSEFPVGDTIVECTATDAAGNEGTASFMVTINPPTPPPADTTAPVIILPNDITEEATSPDGAEISFEVSAQDDVDGPTDVTCDYNSGDTFPIGETVVTCSAEDAAGNSAEESFTITVQDTTAPEVEITEAIDRRNREVADGGTTPTPYIKITFEATDAVGIDSTECSLDGQSFTECTSPVDYDRLSRGTHQFTVRATDEAGNTGEDEFSWTVGNPSPPVSPPGRQ